ncbi:uncharacterized protein BJX67DRAFT_383966 [Aspergillus lucknowensis]|uniref:Cyanovirin-N domain-containing protein n=1 Tax=Aspergillus lucknowensis TaxID=176173 RepID=A0ABR4LIG8_9EURO
MTPSLGTCLFTLLALGGSTVADAAPGSHENVKRDDLTCSGFALRPVGEVNACIDFLHSRGDTTCAINGRASDFCTTGGTKITGFNYSNKESVSSLCRDVAYSLQKVLDSCTRYRGVAGGNAAGENADIFVSIQPA